MSDTDTTAPDNLIGQTIRGYELREMIGIGGFGAVYRAYQAVVDREVAVKIILPEHANDEEFIRRFEREAQFIARLEHLHIIPIYDFWREPGGAYLVMRYLKGGNLLTSLETGGPWPLPAAAALIDQIAAALSVAHRNGIVHQDIKPENILLDSDRNGYLSDFGIAKDIIRGSAEASERYGSPGYASPEQILGNPVTPMSDIFSFSLVVYALLTGATPYKDENTFTLLRKTVYEPLPSIQEKRPDLPGDIDRVLQCASAKDPFARYNDALAMAADFRRAVQLPATISDTGTWSAVLPTEGTYSNPTSQRQSTQLLEILDLKVRNPFKGLRPFEENDSRDYFGRESLIQSLLARMAESDVYSRFLAVVGPSGSGKSSAVSAGLIPALRRGELSGSERWFITQMVPGEDPLRELEEALLRVAVEDLKISLPHQLRQSDDGLHAALRNLLGASDTEVLLYIDQFEELFAPAVSEEDRLHLLNNLVAALTDPNSRLRVIITLRADFYDRPLMVPGFSTLMRDRTETVIPLTQEELEQTILKPAYNAGLTLEDNLATDIIREIKGQAGALPLLQFALTELFERRQGKALTYEAYREIGGVAGALVRRADDLYTEMDENQQTLTRQMFQRLVVLGEGVEDTRRRLGRRELTSIASHQTGTHNRTDREAETILDLFGKFRLLTFDRDPTTRAPTVEIAHEALIRQWSRLREWLANSRDELRIQQRLGLATAEWERMGRETSFLASGVRLVQFESLMAAQKIGLSQTERDYVQTSIRMRQRRVRVRQMAVAGLAIIALVTALASVLAYDGQQRATAQAHISEARRLASNATNGRERLDTRLLYSLQSLNTFDTVEGRASLLNGITSNPRLTAFLTGHQGGVRSVAVSPDGTQIATGGEDGRILLWDAATRQRVGSALTGHTSVVRSLSYSRDGRWLASSGDDSRIYLWSVDSESTDSAEDTPAFTLEGHTDIVWQVAFSPDATYLASAGKDGRVILWDLRDSSPTSPPGSQMFADHTGPVRSVAFSPDGTLLASGGEDQQILLRTLQEPENSQTFAAQNNWITTLAFSPDGRFIASSGTDAVVYLWDVASGQQVLQPIPTGHTLEVNKLAFMPLERGLQLTTASLDNTLKVLDLSGVRASVVTLTGHINGVWDVAYRPDGTGLVSASADGSAILWALTPHSSVVRPLRDHTTPVWSLAYSPDGSYLATGSALPDSTASTDAKPELRLWHTNADGEMVSSVLGNYQDTVVSLAFDADGKTLLVGSEDQSIVFWDVETHTEQARFFHKSGVTSVAFHPEGQGAASADVGGEIKLWQQSGTTWTEAPQQLPARETGVNALAYSTDGRFLVAGYYDNSLVVWDIESGDEVSAELSGHTDMVEAIAFRPDGTVMATGGRDNQIILWDTSNWTAFTPPLSYHTNWVTDLAFTPDGRTLASASRDTTIMLWDVATRQNYGTPLSSHTRWVNAVRFSPDGSTLASASWDTNVLLWDVSLNSWQAAACAIANRDLTLEEWSSEITSGQFVELCPEVN